MNVSEWDDLKKETSTSRISSTFRAVFRSRSCVGRAAGCARRSKSGSLACRRTLWLSFVDHRMSRQGKYVSFTIRLEVESAGHLRQCLRGSGRSRLRASRPVRSSQVPLASSRSKMRCDSSRVWG